MAIKEFASEQMVIRAAQELKNNEVVFVGIGLPNLACNFARATHAPDLFLIYEAGAVGAVPDRLPISIGDPALVTGALSIVSQADIFQNFLQRGLIEVGFLGGAQVDRWGNINSTVIGPYENPKVRLPGSGGACEIATHAKRLLMVMRMNKKTFVNECDFITSPGHFFKGKSRQELKLPGAGPEAVITDMGVLKFVNGEMTLVEIFEGVSVDEAKAQCSWDLKVSSSLKSIKLADQKAIELLQNKLDPSRLYL